MKEIIGQNKIVSQLNQLTLDSLPRTLMLIGPEGGGKHLIASTIAEKFELEVIELVEKVSPEDLIEYRQEAMPRLFIINLSLFTEKQQNQLLKFIEEPPTASYVILLTESTAGLLDTVLNRCTKWTLEPYSKEEIIAITHTVLRNDLVFEVVKAPGQLLNISEKIIDATVDLCTKIIKNIDKASYADALSLSRFINYKEDFDKPDFYFFFNMLELLAFKDFLATNSEQSFKVYTVTNSYKQKLITKTIAKEPFILSFFTNLWKETR